MTTGYLFSQAVFRDDDADMTHAEVMELLVAFIELCEPRGLHTGGTVTLVSEDDGARLPAEARKPGAVYDDDYQWSPAIAVKIVPAPVLKRLSPYAIAGYLAAGGWKCIRADAGRVSIWSQRDGRGRLWLPLDRSLADFCLAMSRVLNEIARVEQRSPQLVIEELGALIEAGEIR